MLIDNKKTTKIGDKLKESITVGSKLSIVSGLMSLYAFDALKKELSQTQVTRLLLTKLNLSEASLLPHLTGDKFEIRLRNKLNQSAIAKECIKWLKNQTEIRTTKITGAVPQTLFHVETSSSDNLAIQGSSQFTSTGLGYTESDNFEMNMCVTDKENTQWLLQWFDDLWTNKSIVHDAKELLSRQLQYLAEDKSAQFIYFLTLYNLFKDFLEDIDEEKIIKTKTGFKDTLVWNKLYKFQKDGVIGAIDKLEKYNGCILADSVGLVKTFDRV